MRTVDSEIRDLFVGSLKSRRDLGFLYSALFEDHGYSDEEIKPALVRAGVNSDIADDVIAKGERLHGPKPSTSNNASQRLRNISKAVRGNVQPVSQPVSQSVQQPTTNLPLNQRNLQASPTFGQSTMSKNALTSNIKNMVSGGLGDSRIVNYINNEVGQGSVEAKQLINEYYNFKPKQAPIIQPASQAANAPIGNTPPAQQAPANSGSSTSNRKARRQAILTSGNKQPPIFKPLNLKLKGSSLLANVDMGVNPNPPTPPVAPTSVTKPSMLSKINNMSKSTRVKLGVAPLLVGGAEYIGDKIAEGYELEDGFAKDASSWLSSAGNVAQTVGGTASLGLLTANPVGAAIGTVGAFTAIAGGAANIASDAIRRIFGDKAVDTLTDKGDSDTVIINGLDRDSGSTTATTLPADDSEMSFTDILDNVAKGKINYETPVSDETLSQTIDNMTNSGIADMYLQGSALGTKGHVNFQDNYTKGIHALLSIRNTLRTANPGSDQYRLAGIASNAAMYGHDTLNAIDSNFNKDLARVNQVMKTYSTGGRYDNVIAKYDAKITDLKEKQGNVDSEVLEYINKENIARDKAEQLPMSQAEIDRYKLEATKRYVDAIAYEEAAKAEALKMNKERRVGSTVSSSHDSSIANLWTSIPGGDEVNYTDKRSNYIAAKAKLNDVQKNALDATILAESGGGRSGILNPNDGQSSSVGYIQFNGPRAVKLIKAARAKDTNPKDPWFQADYIANDIRNPSSWSSQEKMKRFFEASNQDEANRLITEGYIRPKDTDKRVKVLRQYQSN